MHHIRIAYLIFLFEIVVTDALKNANLIKTLKDVKLFKKLLRTRTNVLVVFLKNRSKLRKSNVLFEEVADKIQGLATIAYVDCSESKKICKIFKAKPSVKEEWHFHKGKFNTKYDRPYTMKSMVNFLMDPTGEPPWDEDETAFDVVHLQTTKELRKTIARSNKILIMFYAPWCGYCKKLKPEYAAAATEVKENVVLAAMDVDKPQHMSVKVDFNITGFPTLYYFEKGKRLFQFGGEYTKDGIINWLEDPKPRKPPEVEKPWSDETENIYHLTDKTFKNFLSENPKVLVMFYAPWCRHCKAMKPEYQAAANIMKEQEIDGVLAAVDATVEKAISKENDISGFPTLRYFRDGKFKFTVSFRTSDKILQFMKNPTEPPPSPKEDLPWTETKSHIIHLTDSTYLNILKRKKHALVIFYAPWCGHCKKTKPEFQNAAAHFKDNIRVIFAAVDCTAQLKVCEINKVTGYPTIKYISYGRNPVDYRGGRTEMDFINFMNNPTTDQFTETPVGASKDFWIRIPGVEYVNFIDSTFTFSSFLQDHREGFLVLYYAPWCGHCNAMKAAYAEAARTLAQNKMPGKLAAIDGTASKDIITQHKIQGYPTLKFYRDGRFLLDYTGGDRSKDAILKFMSENVFSPQDADATKREFHMKDEF